MCFPGGLLSLAGCCEKFLAVGKTVGFEEKAEQHRAIRRYGLVLITGGAPDELARSAFALVILKRSFDHVGLFECGVFVQRDHGTGFENKAVVMPLSSV